MPQSSHRWVGFYVLLQLAFICEYLVAIITLITCRNRFRIIPRRTNQRLKRANVSVELPSSCGMVIYQSRNLRGHFLLILATPVALDPLDQYDKIGNQLRIYTCYICCSMYILQDVCLLKHFLVSYSEFSQFVSMCCIYNNDT